MNSRKFGERRGRDSVRSPILLACLDTLEQRVGPHERTCAVASGSSSRASKEEPGRCKDGKTGTRASKKPLAGASKEPIGTVGRRPPHAATGSGRPPYWWRSVRRSKPATNSVNTLLLLGPSGAVYTSTHFEKV